ncbi:hypothetical protein O181_072938 [Austropuccinia psidii MF-1]|uniref:Uncharacterized protein n=1 Tax=Austropuccinia psidii MF-1 TaxID=1389203 RepID=A0A9Q3F3Z4_9BASI|nr:hypothetical protein [Austropuccinia psidii MF-1]
MKELHGRRNWPWWKSQIIQKNRNVTWIWQKTMSFENYKYSVDKDPYELCLRQYERLKAIDPQMIIQMKNHKLLTQIPGELEHAVRFRCNKGFTLDDISNTLQDVRKQTNIGKYSQYRSSSFKYKEPFRVEFKDKAKERLEEVTKKKKYCHNYSMGDAIREQSDEDQAPREELLVEYQEETQLEIKEIQLEAEIPQDTANKNLSKYTQDAQTFLVTPTKGMAYIQGTATKMTVCIENSQHLLIIESGAHFSIVAKDYLDNHFPNWQMQLFPTKANDSKSAPGKMKSIGKIIKEIIIPHRKANIRLNPEFVVLEYLQ